MKKILKKYMGAIIFYSILVIGVILLNVRMEYLENQKTINESNSNLAYK